MGKQKSISPKQRAKVCLKLTAGAQAARAARKLGNKLTPLQRRRQHHAAMKKIYGEGWSQWPKNPAS